MSPSRPSTRGGRAPRDRAPRAAAATPAGGGAVRSGRLAPLAVFVVALAVRGAFLIDSADYPAYAIPIVDALEYDHHAKILAGHLRHLLALGPAPAEPALGSQFFWQPFFYPLYLGVLYLLNGGSVVGAKIVQALLGALTCALVYLLGRRVFGRTAGLVAGIFAALYGPLIFYEAELLAAGWAAFWSVVLVLLLVELGTGRDAPPRGRALWLLFGLTAGLAVLTRPTFLPFVLVAAAWLAWRWWRRPSPRRDTALWIGAALAGFLLVTLPVAVVAQDRTGRFTFLPSSGGINLYIGNHPDPCRMAAIGVGFEWDQLTALPVRAGIVGMWAQQEFFQREVRGFLRDDPAGFLWRLGRKTLQFVSSREIPRNEDIYVVRRWSALQRVLTWKAGRFGFPFGVLLPLAAVGLIAGRRSAPLPLVLFLVLHPLAIILVFVTARYRVEAVPVLAVCAGAGAVELARMMRSRAWRRLALTGGAMLGIVLLASVPGPFCEERGDFEAGLYANMGYYHLRNGDGVAALACYRHAVALDPGLAEAQCNIGTLLRAQGQLAEALPWFEAAVRGKPHLAGIRSSFGAALLDLGRHEEAAAELREALRLDPTLAQAHVNLGVLRMAEGRLADAVAELRTAVRLEPRAFRGHYNLGVALARQGDHAAAIASYRTALELEPDDPGVHYGLAYSLEATGAAATAIEQYRAVMRLNPRYLDAAERLARLVGREP